MSVSKLGFACAALLSAAVAWQQDPRPATPTSQPTADSPQDPGTRRGERPAAIVAEDITLPPIDEPFRSAVERRDLLQRFSEASPLEGFYTLTGAYRDGTALPTPLGYVWFGRGHFMLHIAAVGTTREVPFLQSSVRKYRLDGEQLTLMTLGGHEYAGSIVIDPPGRVETRRVERAGTVLRIHKDERSYFEFERVE